MKELAVEEKAKRYDEAIEELRKMMPNWENLSYNGKTFLQDLVHIIPELQESEDERVRKRIIALVNVHGQGMYKDEMLDWLEKQGEQKSAWKPSDEQMEALSAINVTGDISYAGQGQELINLYNELKKLRGEDV